MNPNLLEFSSSRVFEFSRSSPSNDFSARGLRLPEQRAQRVSEACAGRLDERRILRDGGDDAPIGDAEIVVRDARKEMVEGVVSQAHRRPELRPEGAGRVDRVFELLVPIARRAIALVLVSA